MNEVNDLVNDAVSEINEKRNDECKRKIKNLVYDILENESEIKSLTKRNICLKNKLKELEKPEIAKLEL